VKQLSYLGAAVALVLLTGKPGTAQQQVDSSIPDAENAVLADASEPSSPPINNVIAPQQPSQPAPVISNPLAKELHLSQETDDLGAGKTSRVSNLAANNSNAIGQDLKPVDAPANTNTFPRQTNSGEPDFLLDVPNLSMAPSVPSTENAAFADASVQTLSPLNDLVAQQRPSSLPPVIPVDSPQNQNRRTQQLTDGEPDVLLDVPNLSVDEITLKVKNLRANVALDARLANLLQLTAGADVSIDEVDLTIKGVKAQVLLKVRLDNVASIIDRTLTTIDRNPQILERLLQTVDNTVGTAGNVANTALQPGGVVSQTVGTVGQTLNNVTQPGGLLSQTVNTLGQTVQRTIDSTGNIVEGTLNNTGGLLNQRIVGNLTNLPVLNETRNATGQIVRRVQDNSGAIIEYTLNSAGKIVNPRIIRQATGGQR
jgi:hypothetical protein